MKYFLKKLHLILAFALCTTQHAQAQYYHCFYPAPCRAYQKPAPCKKSDKAVWLGAAILLGAAAGAGCGYAAGQSGRRGGCHHTDCKTCTCCDLTFNFEPVVDLEPSKLSPLPPPDVTFNFSAQSFVTTPQGCTIFGNAVFLNDLTPTGNFLEAIPFLTVTVPNACFGTYDVGMNYTFTLNGFDFELGTVAVTYASATANSTKCTFVDTNITTPFFKVTLPTPETITAYSAQQSFVFSYQPQKGVFTSQ